MSDPPKGAGDESLAGTTVLIVEDEYLIAIDIQRILEAAGCKTLMANRVQSAFGAIASAAQLDVAVLDLKLEREVSTPIAERLHADGMPFVFLTGAPADAKMAAQFEGVPIVAKPFDEQTLLSALKAALATRR